MKLEGRPTWGNFLGPEGQVRRIVFDGPGVGRYCGFGRYVISVEYGVQVLLSGATFDLWTATMEEESKRRFTWSANEPAKKNVTLPLLRRQKPEDQFSVLIESIDHLLTESHRCKSLILPELSAFNNKSIGVFTITLWRGSGR
jgi:hypothetical protein